MSKAAAAKAAKKAEAAAKKAEYKSGARTGSDFRATDAGAKVVVKPGGAAAAPDKIKVPAHIYIGHPESHIRTVANRGQKFGGAAVQFAPVHLKASPCAHARSLR